MPIPLNRFVFLALVSICLLASPGWAQDLSKIPEKGKITLVDLGAKNCIPCNTDGIDTYQA